MSNGVRIPLGGKRAKGRSTIVSAEDFDMVSAMSISVSGKTDTVRPYVLTGGMKLLHRVIMSAPRGMDVDHINGDTLDNRRENLRIVPRSKNLLYSTYKKPGCSSKYRGVAKAIKRGKFIGWQAGISIQHKRKALGTFKSEEEAHNAYQKARLELLSK